MIIGIIGAENSHTAAIAKIINVEEKPIEYSFQLTSDRYPISESASYSVTPIDETGSRGKTTVQTGHISYSGKIAGRDVLFLEIEAHKQP